MKYTLLYIITILGIGTASLPCRGEYYIPQREFIKPKYALTFTHLNFVNPKAPQGGTIRLKASSRTFNTFYPYAFKKMAAEARQLLFASLCHSPDDDPTVAYVYAAKDVEINKEKSYITFYLRPEATFNNGKPITPADVNYSIEFAKQYGSLEVQNLLKNGIRCEILNDHAIRVHITPFSLEACFTISKIPLIPAGSKAIDIPETSGPYKVKDFKMGYHVQYEKVPNWWGQHLPLCKGMYNFKQIEYYYYHTFVSGFEAFKKNLYDMRLEQKITAWRHQYNFKNVLNGSIKKKQFPKPVVHNLTVLVFNMDKPEFNDWRVRKALSLFFNFEKLNQAYFDAYYHRDTSIYMNNGFAAKRMLSPQEDKVLSTLYTAHHLKDAVSLDVLKLPLAPTVHDNGTKTRALWQQAYKLLDQAGWVMEQGTLCHKKTGAPFKMDILVNLPEYGKYLTDYVQTLKKFGIKARIIVADASQYMYRIRRKEYDMMIRVMGTPEIPGREQGHLWGGCKDPLVDILAANIKKAQTMDEIKLYAGLLDRVIQQSYYAILGWYTDQVDIAFYDKFGYAENPYSLFNPLTWWEKRTP